MNIYENKSNLIKIGLYGGFFVFIILVAFVSNRINISDKRDKSNNSNVINSPIIEKINNINDNYFSSKVHFVMDDDAISLDYQRISDVEMGIKKYHGVEKEYTKYKDNYYELNGERFNELSGFIDFDYDRTFMDIVNIKKLLLLEGSKKVYTNNDVNVISISYNLNDVIKIYSEYNNTDIIKYSDGKLNLDISYKNNEILYFIVDITDLYNLINDKDYKNVSYKMEIISNKEEDISWLLDKLN